MSSAMEDDFVRLRRLADELYRVGHSDHGAPRRGETAARARDSLASLRRAMDALGVVRAADAHDAGEAEAGLPDNATTGYVNGAAG